MNAESKQTTHDIIVTPHQPNGKLPIVGHLAVLKKISKQLGQKELGPKMNEVFRQCVGENSTNGDTVFLTFPGVLVYLTSNADYAATMMTDLQHWGKITHKDRRGGYYTARTIVGDALFTASDGEGHSKSHRILMPAFSPRSLSSLVDITLLKTDILLDRFESSRKKPFEIGHAFTSLTFDIIGNFIGGNGLDFKTTENPERMSTEPFLHSMDIALSTKYIHDNIDGGKFTNRKVYKVREDAKECLWDYATNVINDRLDGKTMSTGGKTAPDVLDRMLNTIDKETNQKMDIKLVRDNLITFLLVGHDSTSSLLTSLIYMISQHPKVEAKMRNEVNGVMGNDLPTMQSIKKLPYTTAVIKETLRLFPPAQAIAKTCLKDTKMGPYIIEAGSKAVVLTRELHRNKNLWGETANEFDPERFMPNSSNAPTHEYAWMPFSAGTRGCIGMQFSLIEARIILSRIMQRQITFRLHQDAEVDEKFRTFMKLSNVLMTSHKIGKTSV